MNLYGNQAGSTLEVRRIKVIPKLRKVFNAI